MFRLTRMIRARGRFPPDGTDDICPDASGPARRPWRHHGFQRLRACTGSRMDKNGKRMEETGKSRACIRGGHSGDRWRQEIFFRRQPCGLLEQPPDLRLERRKRAIEGFAPRIEDDGPRGVQSLQFQTHSFPHAATDAIADNRFAERAGRSKPDKRAGKFGFNNIEDSKKGTRITRPLVVNPSKFCRSKQPYTFWETCI